MADRAIALSLIYTLKVIFLAYKITLLFIPNMYETMAVWESVAVVTYLVIYMHAVVYSYSPCMDPGLTEKVNIHEGHNSWNRGLRLQIRPLQYAVYMYTYILNYYLMRATSWKLL